MRVVIMGNDYEKDINKHKQLHTYENSVNKFDSLIPQELLGFYL